MRGDMKYFLKKLLGHVIFRSMVSWATKMFFEKFVKPSGLPSYILNVRSVIEEFRSKNEFSCNITSNNQNDSTIQSKKFSTENM